MLSIDLIPQDGDQSRELLFHLRRNFKNIVVGIEHECGVQFASRAHRHTSSCALLYLVQHIVFDDREIPVEFRLMDHLVHRFREITQKELALRCLLRFVEFDQRPNGGAIDIACIVHIDEERASFVIPHPILELLVHIVRLVCGYTPGNEKDQLVIFLPEARAGFGTHIGEFDSTNDTPSGEDLFRNCPVSDSVPDPQIATDSRLRTLLHGRMGLAECVGVRYSFPH